VVLVVERPGGVVLVVERPGGVVLVVERPGAVVLVVEQPGVEAVVVVVVISRRDVYEETQMLSRVCHEQPYFSY